jgi:hypothetical protein
LNLEIEMKKQIARQRRFEDRGLEGGIEWIVARELAPIQDELSQLRTFVEAIRGMRTW